MGSLLYQSTPRFPTCPRPRSIDTEGRGLEINLFGKKLRNLSNVFHIRLRTFDSFDSSLIFFRFSIILVARKRSFVSVRERVESVSRTNLFFPPSPPPFFYFLNWSVFRYVGFFFFVEKTSREGIDFYL